MTKEEVETIIKRYPFLTKAIKDNESQAKFYVGNRKFVITITKEVKTLCEIIDTVRKREKDEWTKRMIDLIKFGASDTYIMQEIHYSKNAYYSRKDAFIDKVFQCCIYHQLVSLEEILQ